MKKYLRDHRVVLAIAGCIVLLVLALCVLIERTVVRDNFSRIERRMPEEEVAKLLGGPGTVIRSQLMPVHDRDGAEIGKVLRETKRWQDRSGIATIDFTPDKKVSYASFDTPPELTFSQQLQLLRRLLGI